MSTDQDDIPSLQTDSEILRDFHRIIMNNTAMWVNVLDTQARVIMWNRAAERISGYSEQEVAGRSEIWEWLYPDPDYREQIYAKAMEIINQGSEVVDLETRIRCKDGSERVIAWNSHDIRNEQGTVIGSMALGRDVTELYASRKKLEELTDQLEKSNQHLRHLSEIDELTGLQNRRYMENLLQYEWERHVRNHNPLSLIYIDIDYFKNYNDNYGHHQGDKALIAVANLFKQSVRRSTDKLARFGGEEFALILPETDIDEASDIAEQLRQAILQAKIEHKASKIADILSISLGVTSLRPTRSDTIAAFKVKADTALYNAKKLGRNRTEVV